jgi:hypothetical protein
MMVGNTAISNSAIMRRVLSELNLIFIVLEFTRNIEEIADIPKTGGQQSFENYGCGGMKIR